MVRRLSKHELKRRNFLLRNMNLIGSLYPSIKSIYGPYLSDDGRYRVVLYDGTSRKTRQYSKLKMEIKLERLIEEPETVDHDNGNTRDDRYSNLVIRDRVDHSLLDAKRVKEVKQQCIWCLSYFKAKPRERLDKKQAGPFCSKLCIGNYGSSVQKGSPKLGRVKYKKSYYTNKIFT